MWNWFNYSFLWGLRRNYSIKHANFKVQSHSDFVLSFKVTFSLLSLSYIQLVAYMVTWLLTKLCIIKYKHMLRGVSWNWLSKCVVCSIFQSQFRHISEFYIIFWEKWFIEAKPTSQRDLVIQITPILFRNFVHSTTAESCLHDRICHMQAFKWLILLHFNLSYAGIQ